MLRRSLLVVMLVLAPSLLFGATLQERTQLFFGHDDRTALPIDQTPWNAVARIQLGEENQCSGILLAPHWVLTAGHCLLDAQRHRLWPITLELAGLPDKQWDVDAVRYPDSLRRGLQPDGDSFIITPEASPRDFALLHLSQPVSQIAPIPLWPGDAKKLSSVLMNKNTRIALAGYPEDHLTQLMGDLGCQQVKYVGDGLLTHRCDSLPGDSGAPLLLQTQSGWHVVGVQSSAPDAENRWQADNLAVAIPFWKKQLQAWLR